MSVATLAASARKPGLTPHGEIFNAANGIATASPMTIPAATLQAVTRRQINVATTPGANCVTPL